MSRLEELIQELCPDGVEYKTIDEVALIKRGERLTKKNLIKNGEYKVISGGVEPMGYFDKFNRECNTITISSYGYAGYVNFIEENFWANDVCLCIYPTKILNNKYLYYVLKNTEPYFFSKTTKAIPDHIPTNVLLETKIPVPPLEVQREIVRILDSFTLLTAELTAELTARKKQYEYYRNELINQTNEICIMPLKQVVKKSSSGATPSKTNLEYYENGDIPWIRTQDVKFNEITQVDSFITQKALMETAVKWIPENCVIIAISGATAGRCAINKIKATTNQHCLNLQIDESKALYKYVYYCVCNKQNELLSKKQGARGDLNASLILSVKIPIPSLDIQRKIVNVLDDFDAICSDLNIGLPAEIEARQKQYEYYRDKLLTFKELV